MSLLPSGDQVTPPTDGLLTCMSPVTDRAPEPSAFATYTEYALLPRGPRQERDPGTVRREHRRHGLAQADRQLARVRSVGTRQPQVRPDHGQDRAVSGRGTRRWCGAE